MEFLIAMLQVSGSDCFWFAHTLVINFETINFMSSIDLIYFSTLVRLNLSKLNKPTKIHITQKPYTGVEIRKFHLVSTKNTWYNLKIPAPAIKDIISTSRR